MQETWVQSLGWEDPLEKGEGYLLHYSGLENSMNCIVHGVARSQTQLSNFHSIYISPKIFHMQDMLNNQLQNESVNE